MNSGEIANKFELKVIGGKKGLNKEVSSVYISDLLSWVMSHAKNGDAWITVQVHPNVVAVASLINLSCIIIPENIEVENVTIEKANEAGIPILQSGKNSFEIAKDLIKSGY